MRQPFWRTGRSVRILAALAATAVLTAMAAGPASAAPGGGNGPTAAAKAKPVPVAPADAYHPGAGPRVIAKPKTQNHALRPMVAWQVDLTANNTNLWPTQFTTLTATVNQDVGPTPYYLSIFDESSGAALAVCGSGTTCSVSVTQQIPAFRYYEAIVSSYPSSYPPVNQQGRTCCVGVNWRGVSLALAANPSTNAIAGTATLTATTSENIGPSPFSIEIYDITTETELTACGSGSSCSVTVTQSYSGQHRYMAYLVPFTTAFPPAGIQTTSASAFVIWSASGFAVTLTHDGSTITATANQNVGPTPYYIDIYAYGETNDGSAVQSVTRLAHCGTGTTCTFPESSAPGGSMAVAYIADNTASTTQLPTIGSQAVSNVVPVYTQIP